MYIATVLDLFTRRIVGVAVSLRKGTPLVMQALGTALLHLPRPEIFHSDNGKEYEAKAFVSVLETIGSRKAPSSRTRRSASTCTAPNSTGSTTSKTCGRKSCPPI